MIVCPYCGRENDDRSDRCIECGTDLPRPPKHDDMSEKTAVSKLTSYIDDSLFFGNEGGVSPNWKEIVKAVNANVAKEVVSAAWNEIALRWLQQLRRTFGDQFIIRKSLRFLMLSDADCERIDAMLEFSEKALTFIEQKLGAAAWKSGNGPHVIIGFTESDLYYSYIAHFYQEGEYAQSSGIMLNRGYVHIALPISKYPRSDVLVHELAHNCVCHLQLPRWVNEGLAQEFERAVCGANYPLVDDGLAEAHYTYWTPARIQGFWSGTSFSSEESARLSYNLAEILVHLAAEERKDFAGFVLSAKREDSGAAAAKSHIGKSLGEIAAIFLGPGDWEPKTPDCEQAA